MEVEVPDFSGWATKANLRCSDGRTITPDAFKHMNGQQVPLVWQHAHNDPTNILGRAILTHMDEGTRADCYFNSSDNAQQARQLVEHGDIVSLSIFANGLTEKNNSVLHGNIREVSLVIAGANPGAKIDFVQLKHGDGVDAYIEELTDTAIIRTGEMLFHFMNEEDVYDPELDGENPNVEDVYDSLTDLQKQAVIAIVEASVESALAGTEAEHSDNNDNQLTHQEGTGVVTRNVFDQTVQTDTNGKHVLTHAEGQEIIRDFKQGNGTLREAVDKFALKHGINSIDILFPEVRNINNTPQTNTRRMEWVEPFLAKAGKTPFTRIKTIVADITADEARAKGYVKGSYKKDEWFNLTKRTTGPVTVYKKQTFDRDDVLDITDFDMISWVKAEMNIMLKEEIARAALLGDGRDVGDDDHIPDPLAATSGNGIRSILNEHELFKTDVFVNLDDASSSYTEAIEAIMRSFRWYKGSGTPTLYTTYATLTAMLLTKDGMQRRIYNSKAELASALMVDDIVTVEPMENFPDLIGIIVNMSDYNFGSDKGGEVNYFDFFDIDYNKMKYLIETRVSGAMTKILSALVIQKTAAGNAVVIPTTPTWDMETGIVTIPTKTGVVYKNGSGTTLTAGAQTALTAGTALVVKAFPATNYFFETDGLSYEWTFAVPPTDPFAPAP